MQKLNVKTFFDSYYHPYAVYDAARSIAHSIDGLKITGRKVIYTCALKNLTMDMKVAQLASSVAFETSYHHGEAGIGGVICNMAQNFAGSNNINLLEPNGQFGNRLSPVAAAARYIFTHLNKQFREIYKKDDELVLENQYEDGSLIEPKFYVPILPMVLVNGTSGIGTGFASKVLAYNPIDLRKNIIKRLSGDTGNRLKPWYRGFSGKIEEGVTKNQWVFTGKLEIVNTTTIKILELPIGMYLDDFKKTLNKLEDAGIIKDFDDNSSDTQFDITVTVPRTTTALTLPELYDMFKLVSRDTENLTLWTVDNKLRVFDDAQALVDYFITIRLDTYQKRITALIEKTTSELSWLMTRIRFVDFYLKNTGEFKALNKAELIELLAKNQFDQYVELLSMPMWNLTKEKIEEFKQKAFELRDKITELKNTKPQELYIKELQELKL